MTAERYKPMFLATLGLALIWFVVILVCLPQGGPDTLENWIQVDSGVTQQEPISSSKPMRHHEVPRNNVQPPYSPFFTYMKHFQPNHLGLSLMGTLFYQFDPKDLTQDHPVRKAEHDRQTLELGTISNAVDQYVKSEGDILFAFNLLVSNRIGTFRSIPDTRHELCNKVETSSGTTEDNSRIKLQASIIICYYNEAPSALLRTIYTIIKRSPLNLLKEILIVDDFSNYEYNYNKIRPFVTSKLVKFSRTNKREGLIRARLFGAENAKGDVLIFLDSHVEANVGWLEPLLKIVQENKTTIACPMIDLINHETMIYSSSPMVKGGLSWNLNFKWDSVESEKLQTRSDFIKPIKSPTMAGGLYAISRDHFFQLGAYDSGMELWGGENIEMSLRNWMCGGEILILPCSRLGHIFRKKRPYGPGPDQPDSLLINSHRTARVWLDDYLYKFYEANPDAQYLISGDVGHRVELKQKLGCHNFTWFLDNIYPKLKQELDPNDEVTAKPKLFKFPVKRVDRSTKRRNSRMQLQTAHHHHPDVKSPELSKPSNFNRIEENVRGGRLLPKLVSQFQIQSAGSNYCLESKGAFLAQGFTRLVLNRCAEIRKNLAGEILIDNSTILNQLWTETQLHDYRLGDNQCLDLVKNLPSLRKCHGMGSFQTWKRVENQTIVNSSGGLCLGVERVQQSEPIIVTLCDKQLTNAFDSSERLKKQTLASSGWRTGALSMLGKTRRFNKLIDHRMHPLQPCQKWDLIYVDNLPPTSSTATNSSMITTITS